MSPHAVGHGGGYHYMMSLIEGLKQFSDFDVVVYYNDLKIKEQISNTQKLSWRHVPRYNDYLTRTSNFLSTLFGLPIPFVNWNNKTFGSKPDILISQESLFGFYTKTPFISFVGDVMFKYFPELREYTFKRRLIRNLTTKRMVQKSVCTIVDSQQSKEDIMKFYGVNQNEIKPIPLCPPPHIYDYHKIHNLIEKYKLPAQFVFYPAQYWDHKNHIRLIEALHLVKKKYNMIIPIVLVGSHEWYNYKNVINCINKNGMNKQVYCLGYVSDSEMVALYKKSKALVYPSFGDYTNIPVLEAMVLETPVLCSNSFSMPNQVGDAAVLFDPYDTQDIAKKIIMIWNDDELRKKLISSAKIRVNKLSFENFSRSWIKTIESAINENK